MAQENRWVPSWEREERPGFGQYARHEHAHQRRRIRRHREVNYPGAGPFSRERGAARHHSHQRHYQQSPFARALRPIARENPRPPAVHNETDSDEYETAREYETDSVALDDSDDDSVRAPLFVFDASWERRNQVPVAARRAPDRADDSDDSDVIVLDAPVERRIQVAALRAPDRIFVDAPVERRTRRVPHLDARTHRIERARRFGRHEPWNDRHGERGEQRRRFGFFGGRHNDDATHVDNERAAAIVPAAPPLNLERLQALGREAEGRRPPNLPYERRQAVEFAISGEQSHLKLAGQMWATGDEHHRVQRVREIRNACTEILSALHANTAVKLVLVGSDFLETFPTEADQERVFRGIVSLRSLLRLLVKGPVDGAHIHPEVLLAAITQAHNELEELTIWNITINNTSQLELLMNALQARGASLDHLSLKLRVPLAPETNRHGFLDPLLHTMTTEGTRQPPFFRLTGYDEASLNGPPLITVNGLRAYLAEGVEFNGTASRSLTLEGLGLTDDHCQVIGEHFSTYESESSQMLRALWLRKNPSIGPEGYAVLLGLLNQHYATLESIRVDDKNIQQTFDFVVKMNTKFGRGQFLNGGIFSNRTSWLAWLEWLKKNAAPTNESEHARNVSFIFYSLQECPGFLLAS